MNTYNDLNAELQLYGDDGQIQLEKDKLAAKRYFLEYVNPRTVFFHNLKEKVDFMTEHGYWDKAVLNRYHWDHVVEIFDVAYSWKFRFPTFMGAFKFYTSYAMRDENGFFLERYEDRVVLNALAYSDNAVMAKDTVRAILSGRFQPATPTFLNAGRAQGGEPVSCFLLRVEDNMESISRAMTDSLQLSKRGGGVALSLTNIRERKAAIKNIPDVASGVVPIMKILEDSFSYANQLGQRSGAGAVYLSVHHPDIMEFLDTKRENADEKIRIKTLSLGVVIPDVTFELARDNKDMYLFSPHDVLQETGVMMSDQSITEHYDEWVENPNIRKKKISARKLFSTLAELQFESGYPYIMYEDTANRLNPVPNIGRIVQSNLCVEVMQPSTPGTFYTNGTHNEIGRDISCNLGSLNVAKMMEVAGTPDFQRTVEVAQNFLSRVSIQSDLSCSPSVENGNNKSRAIGIGQMNLHGYLLEQGIKYDSQEARDFFNAYMADVTYYALEASNELAVHQGTHHGFQGSRWQDGSYIENMMNHVRGSHNGIDRWQWEVLQAKVAEYGLYNQHLQAIPPTGSISYINFATPSILPITSPIEVRKEGRTGRVYVPAYGLTKDNFEAALHETAYEVGPNAIIDMVAESVPFVDQSTSMTLFFKDTATTRDVNKAQIYAHRKGIKSIYYIRLLQKALAGTEIDNCVSCTL